MVTTINLCSKICTFDAYKKGVRNINHGMSTDIWKLMVSPKVGPTDMSARADKIVSLLPKGSTHVLLGGHPDIDGWLRQSCKKAGIVTGYLDKLEKINPDIIWYTEYNQ